MEGKKSSDSLCDIVGDYREGGLKLVYIKTKANAMPVQTVKKYLYGKEKSIWNAFTEHFFHKMCECEKEGIFMDVRGKKYMMDGIPSYYIETFNIWSGILNKL